MATSVFSRDPGRGQVMAKMNITPLVDVMLVLLIIFMIAAPLVTGSVDVRLPQAPNPGPDTAEPPRLELQVLPGGRFVLDGVPLGEPALRAALVEAVQAAPATVVEIRASEQAEYQAFTTAMVATRQSGVANIALR